MYVFILSNIFGSKKYSYYYIIIRFNISIDISLFKNLKTSNLTVKVYLNYIISFIISIGIILFFNNGR